jgi:pyruvate dehydrogenase (quinone)
VVAAIGDGAMQMLGNTVLITIANHFREWTDPRLVVVVLNNRDLNMVTWEQRATGGDPKFEASQNLPDFPYARYARMLGLLGLEIDTPDGLGDAFDLALDADRPCVVEVHTDPEVPPLPPHVSWDQAKNFMSAVIQGDPNRWRMIVQATKDLIAGR